MANLAVRRKRFNQKRSSRFSAKPAPVNPSRRPRCSTPMRIQAGSVMFANAVGGPATSGVEGFCADGGACGVCADAGVDSDARVRKRTMSAMRILMRHVMSNRSARRVFVETLENARENGRGQREEPEGNPTEMFRRT